MDKPLVSIAVPTYKPTFLREAVESLLSQTYSNLEIIVVNDRSPHDIDTIMSSFRDERIHYYVNEKNLGAENPAHNWNKCLSLAMGDFFCLLCDDDIYASDYVETMLSLAADNPRCNVFRARACYINREGKETDWYPSSPYFETSLDYMWHTFKGVRKQTISEFFYRTSHIKQCGGYALLPLAWYADYLSIFTLAMEGGIVSTYEKLVKFRLSGENISSQDDRNTITKIHATNQFIDAVVKLLAVNNVEKSLSDTLVALMLWHTNQNTKYSLEHAPRRVLWSLWRKSKRYRLRRSMIWKAFLHHKKC
ncbi:MAG: glycosyltransferase family 2 protein [Bacteroidaceae bacterium]|nr:glycosyltransferase family 2 protein [Bacteroidaceae bacterium]